MGAAPGVSARAGLAASCTRREGVRPLVDGPVLSTPQQSTTDRVNGLGEASPFRARSVPGGFSFPRRVNCFTVPSIA